MKIFVSVEAICEPSFESALRGNPPLSHRRNDWQENEEKGGQVRINVSACRVV